MCWLAWDEIATGRPVLRVRCDVIGAASAISLVWIETGSWLRGVTAPINDDASRAAGDAKTAIGPRRLGA